MVDLKYSFALSKRAFGFILVWFICFTMWTATAASSNGSNLAEALSERAATAYSAGQVDSAIVFIRQAIAFAHRCKRKDLEISSLASLGVYQRSTGNTSAALRTYERALSIAVKADIRSRAMAESVASLYINLATLYLDTGQHNQALTYARKAVQLDNWLTDPAFRAQLYPAAGSIFLFNKHYREAESWIGKGIEAAKAARMVDTEVQARCYLAMVFLKTGKKPLMNRELEYAGKLVTTSRDVMQKFTFLQTSAAIYLQSGDTTSAEKSIRSLLSTKGIEHYPYIAYDAWNNLHICYAQKGEYRQAYEALARAAALRDSISAQEKGKAMQEMAVKYETREKELKLQEAEARRRAETMQAGRRIGFLLFSLAVVSGCGAWFWQRQRTRTEKERCRAEELEREYTELERGIEQRLTRRYLEGLEAERNRLATELHDGVANDLLAIEMKLKASVPPSADETAMDVEMARDAVRSISHNLLPPVFREATLDDVLWNYTEKLSEKGNTTVCYTCHTPQADWASLPREAALAAYRITQEAVSNSIKHAGTSHISVITFLSDSELVLTIQDSGIGFPSRHKTGAGMQTMRQRAETTGGRLEVVSDVKGTKISFILPLKN